MLYWNIRLPTTVCHVSPGHSDPFALLPCSQSFRNQRWTTADSVITKRAHSTAFEGPKLRIKLARTGDLGRCKGLASSCTALAPLALLAHYNRGEQQKKTTQRVIKR